MGQSSKGIVSRNGVDLLNKMKPYYQDDCATIYLGDTRDVLPSLEKSSIDLTLTDPPFFMPAKHYQSRVRWQKTWGDTSILKCYWSVILDALIPLMKVTGHVLTFCNHESYPVFYPEVYSRFDFIKALVWDKGHVGLGRVWRNQHELIIAARWNTSVFYDDGKLRADVLKFKVTPSQDREHPVEKPELLLTDLMMPTTKEGNTILDLFMGSGTTLSAAKLAGRKAVGIEIEERYCEIAAKRLSQEVLSFEPSQLVQYSHYQQTDNNGKSQWLFGVEEIEADTQQNV